MENATAEGRKILRTLAAGVVVFLAWAAPLHAAQTPPATAIAKEDPPVTFSANQLNHDRELEIITAKGNVEVHYEDRVLFADAVTYNQRIDILSATGNISLLEPTGEVVFAQYMELTGDLKDGIVRDLQMILSDGARVAAAGGKFTDGNRTQMSKAVYSACDLCKDNPQKPPLWQIKAVKVIHDKRRQRIEYRDAWLELAGMPIVYMPYFSHPDPTAKKKTGFLTPKFRSSTDFGLSVKIPFYINIAPNMDAILTSVYTQKEGPALAMEFRSLLDRGFLKASGSVTRDSKDQIRGHILSQGQFDINDTWRWGFNLERASDGTYMRRYGYGFRNPLTSQVAVEGFWDRNYFSAKTYWFQDVSADSSSGDTPFVLPLVRFSHAGRPDRFGGRSSLDLSLLSLMRTHGADTQRLSAKAGWVLPYVSDMGSVYRLEALLRGDGYYVNGLDREGEEDDFTGLTGRLHPELALTWSHPLVRWESDGGRQIIEPIIQGVLAPYGGNPSNIPNEDSWAFDFDDTNLFALNRFSGTDRVESGPRLNYGISWDRAGSVGGRTAIQIGQTYRPRADSILYDGTGPNDSFSDIVGSLHIMPKAPLRAFYRIRLDKDDFKLKTNELSLSAGTPALHMNMRYLFLDHEDGLEFPTREELYGTVGFQLTQRWRGNISALRDMNEEEMRSMGLNLSYEDECFIFSASVSRTFYQDRDLRPTDAITFDIIFKTLGEVRVGATRSRDS